MIHPWPGLTLLEDAGRRAFPGFALRTVGETSSTQDVVREAARSGAEAGFCCLAAAQTAGRGRQDRRWSAPPGSSLLASVLVRAGSAGAGCVPIAAGLALRAAIAATSGTDAQLKWPNDVVVDGRKLAGILCEVEPAAPGAGTAVVVGLGVNLRVAAFPVGVVGVSLHSLVDEPPFPARLLAATLPELAQRLARLPPGGLGPLRAEWMAHAAGLGRPVTATSAAGSVTGCAEEIDEDGALVLRTDAGAVRILAGEVHLVAPDAAGHHPGDAGHP